MFDLLINTAADWTHGVVDFDWLISKAIWNDEE